MSLHGETKGRLPRTTLPLPAHYGGIIEVAFIVDTAFDGELALPAPLARQIGFASTEILELEGNALIGTVLLWEMLIQTK